MSFFLCHRVKAKLQEIAPDRVEPFMANAPAEVKKILGNIKNYQVIICVCVCVFLERGPSVIITDVQ